MTGCIHFERRVVLRAVAETHALVHCVPVSRRSLAALGSIAWVKFAARSQHAAAAPTAPPRRCAMCDTPSPELNIWTCHGHQGVGNRGSKFKLT